MLINFFSRQSIFFKLSKNVSHETVQIIKSYKEQPSSSSDILIILIHNIHILLVHKSLYVSCETILPKSISLTYPQL